MLKNIKVKTVLVFMLIMMTYMCFSSITVHGGYKWYLLEDDGSSPGSWRNIDDEVASVTSLKNGPPSGNPGYFYYFKNDEDGTRELKNANITRTAYLNSEQLEICKRGQMTVNFSVDYYGWTDDNDQFQVCIYRNDNTLVHETGFYIGNRSWKTLQKGGFSLPKDTTNIRIKIYAVRESGSDLDVYLDNIKVWLSDETPPYMIDATVTEIRDYNGNMVPLKKDETTNEYLDNWVNPSDTIYGTVKYNEPVDIFPGPFLRTNILVKSGSMLTGDVPRGKEYSHQYYIPLGGADRLRQGDNYIQFYYNSDGSGPFVMPVRDVGGNAAIYLEKPNIDKYKLKLDNASPEIISPSWPFEDYEAYSPGRTSVDIVVREENRGTEQSPLTLSYHWVYWDTKGFKIIEPEKKMQISSTVVPVVDDIYTTYTVKIDIPNGSGIPPYQEFTLYAEVGDEARRGQQNDFIFFTVNQKDATPPNITWDKSIHEDDTVVDLNAEEDTLYTTSRTVSFSAKDLESGVDEVKYSWTREPYKAGDVINKVVLPGEDSKYHIQGTSSDAPLEGKYYLNILAVNGTKTETISSKAFYFDNQGPRVTGDIIDIDNKPAYAHYHVEDRALQNKFLYALLTMDMDTRTYEAVTEPDISKGIKDDGMWHALDIDSIAGTEGTTDITGVLDKISDTGYYKLITRFYDENYNCQETAMEMVYDFDPPTIKVIDLGEPEVFKKRHEVTLDFLSGILLPGVVIEINDMSYVDIWGEDFSVNWIDAATGEKIPAGYTTVQGWIIISGSDSLNGRYYLNVKAKDFAGNAMDETVFADGKIAEFYFDNSSPMADITYDKEIAGKLFRFSYSKLKDAYSDVELFQYGISKSSDNEPTEWIDIGTTLSEGEITYPIADGIWYLHIKLQDTLGNKQIISFPEPFLIDTTEPSGKISFTNAYNNKLNAALNLEIDELKTISNKTFKTILSDDKTMLEGEAIGGAQAVGWKDITYENGLAIYNWVLTDKEDGEQKVFARFMDEAGNISDIYETSIILDRTPPTGEVTYDITEPTAGNVTARLTMDDNYNVTLLNNDGLSSYVFNRNGEFEFVLMDDAGNKVRIKAKVKNIDKDPPKASVTYSHPRDMWTNKSIIADLHLEDINGFKVLSEGGLTHTFDENGKFLFEFEDILGNKGSIKAEIKNIDKEPPVGSIIYTYSHTSPVTVYLSVYEPVEVTNNEGSFRYVFDENGEFTFKFEDKAGNKGEAVASVDTIASAERYVDVVYSDSGRLTYKDIIATFTSVSDLACITSPTVTEEVYGPYEYTFTDNGDWPVSIRVFSAPDEENIRTVTGSVYNIDRTPPEAYLYLSTIELTNEDVTATLLAYDDRGKTVTIKNNNGKSEHVFDKNGTFKFEFEDEAGNKGYKEITVSNIDKEVPGAEIRYYTKETKPNSKFAEISFTGEAEKVEILNNNGSDTFEFVENGSFTFMYSDKAGNKGEATARVDNLSDSVSAGTIEYYIRETKIDDPDKMMINESVTAKLVLDEEGGPYTIVNNGGSSSYTFLQNGEFTFVYEDGNSNRGFTTAKVSTIDKESPKLQILADVVRATRENVIITVSYSDNVEVKEVIHNMEPENITFSESGFTYICIDYKEIEVTVVDIAGNETTKKFIVDYIDKEAPIGTITYTPSSFTNNNVRAVLTLNEPARILNNNGKAEYIFTQNGEFVFEFQDYAGNKGSKTAVVTWIDKILPKASLEYSNTAMTNKPVEVTLKAEEGSKILNNGGSAKRVFYRNGEFTFRVRDEAGNIAEIKAEVKNIDSDMPIITLKGSPYVTLFQDEAYTEQGYTAVDNVDGDISTHVTVEGSVDTTVPGIYILKYKVSDAVGNSNEATRTVKILSPGELVLLLNDEVAEGESIILNKRDVKVSALCNEGSLKIKWDKGKRTQAYFKTEGYIAAPGGIVSLEAYNWYTFFVQDRERRIKTIQVYVNE